MYNEKYQQEKLDKKSSKKQKYPDNIDVKSEEMQNKKSQQEETNQ